MAMSEAKLRRLAEAEDQGSVAAGAVGVNALLLHFDRQNDHRAGSAGKSRVPTASGGGRAKIYSYNPRFTPKP